MLAPILSRRLLNAANCLSITSEVALNTSALIRFTIVVPERVHDAGHARDRAGIDSLDLACLV
jgi:hypothetical protein